MSDLTPEEIISALTGARVLAVHVRTDDEGGIQFLVVRLDTGLLLTLQAHGFHSEGWLYVEEGRRVPDIYGIDL